MKEYSIFWCTMCDNKVSLNNKSLSLQVHCEQCQVPMDRFQELANNEGGLGRKKKMANNPYEYECYANDNHIRIYAVDGEIDEIHFSDPSKKDWLIIEYGDLEAAIRNAQNIIDRTV